MNFEFSRIPEFAQEKPQSVVDVTVPFFDDFGYRSLARVIRAIEESLYERVPVLVTIMGEPENGKQHELLDINSRLHKRKRSEGVLTKIAEEQGYAVPVDVIYWGNSFSVAKIKGRLPENKSYGELNDQEMSAPVEEYEELVSGAISERQGQAAVVFAKLVGLTGVWIDGKLCGRERGVTICRRIVAREGPFAGLDYKTFFIGEVADPDAIARGNDTRIKGEKLIDKPPALVQMLKQSGEAILTGEEGQPELSEEQQQAVVEYISEGANVASAKEIKGYVNNLVIKLSETGRLRLNGIPYQFNRGSYFFDEETQTWEFFDPRKRMLGVALLMRYTFEENIGLKNKVFLGKTAVLDDIILDLRYPMRNVAKAYYPGIVRVKNK